MNLPLHLLTLSFRLDETPIFSSCRPSYPDQEHGAVYATMLRTVPAPPSSLFFPIDTTVLCMTDIIGHWQLMNLDAYSKQVLANALTTHNAKPDRWYYFYLERAGCYLPDHGGAG